MWFSLAITSFLGSPRSKVQCPFPLLKQSTGVCKLAWLSRLFHELGIENITPIPVKYDSQAAIYIAKNPVFHERTKHIELDCHVVREKLLAGLISLHHVSTKAQLADILTKPLPGVMHHDLLCKLGVQRTTNLRGGVGDIYTHL